jgi:hypothetical protein
MQHLFGILRLSDGLVTAQHATLGLQGWAMMVRKTTSSRILSYGLTFGATWLIKAAPNFKKVYK